MHSGALDGVYLCVDVLTAAVVLRGVHVHDQRLSGDAFCGDSGIIREPVVCVDDVELSFEVAGDLGGDHGIAGNLLHEVRAVFSREGVSLFPGVGRRPRALPRLDILLVIGLILLGGDVGNHVRVDMDERHFFQYVIGAAPRGAVERLHVAGIHHVDEALVFVAVGVGDDERYVDTVASQPASHSVAGCTQSSGNMGWKFPSEH